MGLKNDKGEYIHIAGIEGLRFAHKKISIRIFKYDSEEARKENFSEPSMNYFEEVEIPEDFSIDGASSINEVIQKIAYPALKSHKVWSGENKHEAETDKNGEVIKEAWTETLYNSPYADYTDC